MNRCSEAMALVGELMFTKLNTCGGSMLQASDGDAVRSALAIQQDLESLSKDVHRYAFNVARGEAASSRAMQRSMKTLNRTCHAHADKLPLRVMEALQRMRTKAAAFVNTESMQN